MTTGKREKPFDFAVDASNDAIDKEIIDVSDQGIADRLIAVHKGHVKYAAQWGRWLVWDDMRWKPDFTGQAELITQGVIRNVAKRLARQRYLGLITNGKYKPSEDDTPEARRMKQRSAKRQSVMSVAQFKSSNKRDGVLRAARVEDSVALSVDALDADPWLLNTPNGVVDLRTGRSVPHRASFLMTKITTVGPEAKKPVIWLDFLHQITGGDNELIRYLQRVAGYCLTGTTNAQTLFFGYGPGGNGKSVFVNVLSDILGDYYRQSEIETFLQSNNSRHPTEIADLQGARFVTASETVAGRQWNESRIKTMTGGERLTARFMYRDLFTYMPQFKLFIIGNHRPYLSAVNEAIRRRLHLVPFTITIPDEKRDPYLQERLIKSEAGAILNWMIEGCIEYNRLGLASPPAVVKATEEYLRAEDVIEQWLTDCCEWDANHFTSSRDLFKSWTNWALTSNERVGNERSFKAALLERAQPGALEYKVQRINGKPTRGYEGLRVVDNKKRKRSREEIAEEAFLAEEHAKAAINKASKGQTRKKP